MIAIEKNIWRIIIQSDSQWVVYTLMANTNAKEIINIVKRSDVILFL